MAGGGSGWVSGAGDRQGNPLGLRAAMFAGGAVTALSPGWAGLLKTHMFFVIDTGSRASQMAAWVRPQAGRRLYCKSCNSPSASLKAKTAGEGRRVINFLPVRWNAAGVDARKTVITWFRKGLDAFLEIVLCSMTVRSFLEFSKRDPEWSWTLRCGRRAKDACFVSVG